MAEVTSIPHCCSPVPPLACELTIVEEEKSNSSRESTGSPVVYPTISQKIIAELVGSYIVVFAGCGSVLIDQRDRITIMGIAIVWGLVVMVMIYTVGHVSGAHLNPAVSIAFAVAGQFPWKQVPTYAATHVIGSTAAVLTLKLLFLHQVDIKTTVTRYSSPTTDLDALAWEFIIAFFLMFTACGVATDHRAINELSGVAVGAIILLNALIAGRTTGSSMNPARSIASAVVSNDYHKLWVYIIGPTLGAVAGAVVYNALRLPIPNKSHKKNTKSTSSSS